MFKLHTTIVLFVAVRFCFLQRLHCCDQKDHVHSVAPRAPGNEPRTLGDLSRQGCSMAFEENQKVSGAWKLLVECRHSTPLLSKRIQRQPCCCPGQNLKARKEERREKPLGADLPVTRERDSSKCRETSHEMLRAPRRPVGRFRAADCPLIDRSPCERFRENQHRRFVKQFKSK